MQHCSRHPIQFCIWLSALRRHYRVGGTAAVDPRTDNSRRQARQQTKAKTARGDGQSVGRIARLPSSYCFRLLSSLLAMPTFVSFQILKFFGVDSGEGPSRRLRLRVLYLLNAMRPKEIDKNMNEIMVGSQALISTYFTYHYRKR